MSFFRETELAQAVIWWWRRHRLLRKYPTLHFGYLSKAFNCSFGKHTRIYSRTTLNNVEFGDYSYAGSGCHLNLCKIGKYCSIAQEVMIGLGIHPLHFKSTHPGFYAKSSSYYGFEPTIKDPGPEYKEVIVGNDVWIGTRAMILDGVTVGDGAVIAAGAVVTKDVPPYAIVGGVPAKVIKYRFPQEEIEKLLAEKWWDKTQQ